MRVWMLAAVFLLTGGSIAFTASYLILVDVFANIVSKCVAAFMTMIMVVLIQACINVYFTHYQVRDLFRGITFSILAVFMWFIVFALWRVQRRKKGLNDEELTDLDRAEP